MKYFIDTEFYEKPNTISLISMAIVSEDDRVFYRWNSDYDPEAQHDEWLLKNVFKYKPSDDSAIWIPQNKFARYIMDFIEGDQNPEFWGYYCDYDWVIFCWQFGRMIDLPKAFPMYCRDLKQLSDSKNKAIFQKTNEDHNALSDAIWIKDTYYKIC